MTEATHPAVVEVPHWFGYERAFQTWWFPEHRGSLTTASKAVGCQYPACCAGGMACYGTGEGALPAVADHDVRVTACPSERGALTFLCPDHARKLGFCTGCGRFEGEFSLVHGFCVECKYWDDTDHE